MKFGGVPLALLLLGGICIGQQQPGAPPNATPDVSTPNGAEDRIYGPKDGAKPPRLKYSPYPEYPKKARKAHQHGFVVLRLIVGSDGLPRDLEVARSLSPELDQAALDVVKTWKFYPATKDGKPVSVRINIEVQFKLW